MLTNADRDLRATSSGRKQARFHPAATLLTAASTLSGPQDIDDDEYLVAIKSARELYDAKPKYGGSIRFFMLWDLLTIVAIVLFHLSRLESLDQYVRSHGGAATISTGMTAGSDGMMIGVASIYDTFMFNVTLSYMKTFYALFSWPFLIFMVPVVGGAFAEARPTAYDKAGMLCPILTAGQLKTKYDFERANKVGDFRRRMTLRSLV